MDILSDIANAGLQMRNCLSMNGGGLSEIWLTGLRVNPLFVQRIWSIFKNG
jgi:hypothetical protein